MSKAYTAGSGMSLNHVQVLIDNLDESNYKESLEMIEPFLLNEADTQLYQDSMKRIYSKAHTLGIEVPEDFAQDGKYHLFSVKSDDSPRKTAGSGMQLQHVELLIKNLTGHNFDASLDMIEPFLLNEADAETRQNALDRIAEKAKKLGTALPANFCKQP